MQIEQSQEPELNELAQDVGRETVLDKMQQRKAERKPA